MLLFVCLFVIAHGGFDMLHGLGFGPVQALGNDRVDNWNQDQWSMEHPYIYFVGSESGLSWLFRLKGLGLINDPNDFGQFTVCVIPLVFIFWRPKKMLLNTAFVIVPVCVLIYGVYLTHSRGALLALIAMAVVFGRRRIGTVPSLLLAGGLFVVAMALNFTGGRQISAASGEDRTALWGAAVAATGANRKLRHIVLACSCLVVAAQMSANFLLLHAARNADYTKVASELCGVIPPGQTAYGTITFWLALHDRSFISYERTDPWMAANQFNARYFITGDRAMTSGFPGDYAFNQRLRRSMAEVIAQSKLVGHFPDPYYGDLKVYELYTP
jgi:hypothetical protein